MKKLLLAVTFTFLASLTTFAQTSTGGGRQAQPQFATFKSEALKATYISNGDLGATLGSGDQPVDAVHTVKCAAACTIQADGWIEAGAESNAFNEVALCFYVDGSLVNGTCYWSGEVPADSSYVQATSSIVAPGLAAGSHKVQMHLYTFYGAFVGYYNINYRVYKP
jgi:hypothetical protein